ncbi:hypothetical protein RIF29_27332 [Crotalaria pallida]|uniref:Uncharacterized protein n=1 Tax=Crotalaria pallida TaxID=3830 RepID=A0AAN9ENW5_CROPI
MVVMETLAEQNLGEKHEKPSSEEDDQKARSNKKVKTDEMRSSDVVEMVDIQKSSYREEACPEAVMVQKSSEMEADQGTAATEMINETENQVVISTVNASVINGKNDPSDSVQRIEGSEKIEGSEFGPWMMSIIAAVVPPSVDAGADSITWAKENDGAFSIASTATFLQDSLRPGNFNGTSLLFRLVRDILPDNERRYICCKLNMDLYCFGEDIYAMIASNN